MNVQELLKSASLAGASDIFLVAGLPLSYRLHGSIKRVSEEKLLPDDTMDLVNQIYELANNRSTDRLLNTGDDDGKLCGCPSGSAAPKSGCYSAW